MHSKNDSPPTRPHQSGGKSKTGTDLPRCWNSGEHNCPACVPSSRKHGARLLSISLKDGCEKLSTLRDAPCKKILASIQTNPPTHYKNSR